MSEYLRHTADHVLWLVRQKRREAAETGQLAARLNRILQRRGLSKGVAGILGPEEVRHVAGVARSSRAEAAHEAPEPVEPPAESVEEAKPEEPSEEQVSDATLRSTLGSTSEVVMPPEEAAELVEVVEEIQTAPPEPEEPPEPERVEAPEPERARPSPPLGIALADEEVPFEAALEPQALVPPRVEFARAADEVFFRRAIERLGMGQAHRLQEGIRMLGQVPSDAAAAVLINLYRIAPRRWRPDVIHQLVTHAGAGVADFFCRVLEGRDEPPTLRTAALRGLFARDKALAAEYLLRALDDPSEAVRAAAATYLGWLREKRAIPGLETLLGDASQQVANAALHAAALIRG